MSAAPELTVYRIESIAMDAAPVPFAARWQAGGATDVALLVAARAIEAALLQCRRDYAESPARTVALYVGRVGYDPLLAVTYAPTLGDSVNHIAVELLAAGLLPGELYVLKENGEWQMPRTDQ